ncbi:MAG: cohesin domain-containing protein [Candidatus Bathyarchaeia archaeon]
MNKLKTFLIIALLASTMALYASKKAAADVCTTLSVSPSQQDSWMYWGSGSGNGTVYEISVDVVISNVTDMAGWQFGLYWNNNYLNCDSVTIQNPTTWNETINVDVSNGIDNSYNSTNGYFGYANAAAQPCPDFNGTLTIATLTFHQLTNVSATTPLNIDIVDTELVDGNFNDIAFSSTDGSVVMHTGVKSTSVSITGNGSTIQLDPYPGSWSNWQCCQSSDSDTSYVMSSEEDNNPYNDLYVANCSWIPAAATNTTVTVHILVRSTSTSHKAICRPYVNATSRGSQLGSSCNPGTTYQDYSSSFSITQSDGSGLQIGVQITSGRYSLYGIYYYCPGYCTQVYAVITWS